MFETFDTKWTDMPPIGDTYPVMVSIKYRCRAAEIGGCLCDGSCKAKIPDDLKIEAMRREIERLEAKHG